jgi:hypothetical protein
MVITTYLRVVNKRSDQILCDLNILQVIHWRIFPKLNKKKIIKYWITYQIPDFTDISFSDWLKEKYSKSFKLTIFSLSGFSAAVAAGVVTTAKGACKKVQFSYFISLQKNAIVKSKHSGIDRIQYNELVYKCSMNLYVVMVNNFNLFENKFKNH